MTADQYTPLEEMDELHVHNQEALRMTSSPAGVLEDAQVAYYSHVEEIFRGHLKLFHK